MLSAHRSAAQSDTSEGAPTNSAQADPTEAHILGRGNPYQEIDADLERARILFQHGLGHVEAERWEEAAKTFRIVLGIRKSDVVTYNLASALVQLGELGEAAEILEELSQHASTRAVKSAAAQLLSQIEPQVSRVRVQVLGKTEGLQLFVDDRQIADGWLSRAIPVTPGDIWLHLKRGGELVASLRAQVHPAAEPTQVTLEVVERVPQPAPIEPQQVAIAAQTPPSFEIRTPSAAQARDSDGRPITGQWWFWTAGAGVALGTAILVAVVAGSSGGGATSPTYVGGDAGLVVGKVAPTQP